MKKSITTAIMAIAVLCLTISTQSGVKKPPLEKTNAPGESNCTDCHSGTALNGGGGNMSIVFSGANNKYKPNKTYTITISVYDLAESDKGGFEATILNSSNVAAGTVTITDSANTMQRHDNANGRDYSSNFFGEENKVSWSFQWKSPSTPEGKITIYACTNATNNDSTYFGDHVYAGTLVLKLKNPLKEEEFAQQDDDEFSVFPTIVDRDLNIKYVVDESSGILLSLYNLQGQLQETLTEGQRDGGVYEETFTLNKNYIPGIYLLIGKMNNQTFTRKVMIQ
jgi:hypothetical protein